ncbi:ubiquinol cytochrome-c reductase assembly protein Cbp3 [Schizosaccharomyces japonicus yFS275]|uniref:Ubiquinol cytochrome-c reductase assembly protein Cbp3 n=1 Tax=Schizosaccharomyces japonicus (strain yFS275 / FY16936) TaxID=402676 RepID=B6JZV1_SCHJY|nr:ubiquinol cytochrome-c reductase assembly protein Cbp3 [Schizosaccharomyces japonicus yFS275]EEB06101.1 ubiquinol cytochrome-c reductase assembly protein Cbp3 [Schizosaccharomyces japonicus yFS275]
MSSLQRRSSKLLSLRWIYRPAVFRLALPQSRFISEGANTSNSQSIESSINGFQSEKAPLRERFSRWASRFLPRSTLRAIDMVAAVHRFYRQVIQQCDYSPSSLTTQSCWWYKECGLSMSFQSWFQVAQLHIWLLTTRIRCFPKDQASAFSQALADVFFEDMERRMSLDFEIHSNRMVQTYLRDFNQQRSGAVYAYDQSFLSGDAEMAAAVWRNLFRSSEEVDMRLLALIVAYIRANVTHLSNLSDSVLMNETPQLFIPINSLENAVHPENA